ncbi:MAG TPA: type II toxin-antitoxin system ParD family antitoxin [Caulobacteraceae bacterium]
MATRNVSLTAPLDRFVEDLVTSGEFQNASEVVREGLRLLKRRTEVDAAKLERLKGLIQEGVVELDRGEGEVVEDLGAWFDGIEAELDGR